MKMLPKTLCESMDATTSNGSQEIPTKTLKQDKVRCVMRPRSKDNKATISCIKCNNFTCKNHSLYVCRKCMQN